MPHTVYRGVSGKVLPKEFFHERSSSAEPRGGVEMGFMSTTTQRDVALAYAAQGSGILFEIHMGLVDRGAQLGWLSQYPTESEILFAPLTTMEIVGLRTEGTVVVGDRDRTALGVG